MAVRNVGFDTLMLILPFLTFNPLAQYYLVAKCFRLLGRCHIKCRNIPATARSVGWSGKWATARSASVVTGLVSCPVLG